MTERHCLVTGGSRGIGRAIAVRMAADGYDVSFCYASDGAAAEETSKLVAAHGVRCFPARCDVADYDAVEQLVRSAERELGEVDVLVNCAGIARDALMVSMPVADWHAVLDTNLSGTFNTCRALSFAFAKRRRGTIVNVSSVSGVYGQRGQTNYSASKAGIHGLSRALAKELAGLGIRVNVVAPGFIETDMTGQLPDKARKAALATIPLRRFGAAGDVAEMVSFLASDRAAYVTGQVVQVDGGIVI